jgi:asparagine synthase (glutamine-hydrolysing)
MSGIFGLVHLDNSPTAVESLQSMRSAMAFWGPDGGHIWHAGSAGLGSLVLFNAPQALHERVPIESARGFILTAEARLDNRLELMYDLGISPADGSALPDGDLILHAYENWGEETPRHLIGDWSFAVWQPAEKKLFLARDHFGNTSVYYYANARRFAFASDRKALFALGIPRRLNEFYLACGLISWPAHHGPQTIELDLHRLPPGHTLTLKDGNIQTNQYWRLEDVPELKLKKSQDYIDGFLEVYDRAVRDRLRSHRPIGVTLSGGLDSGSITGLAARALNEQGIRLPAYTSVPLYNVSNTVDGNRFGDELPFAQSMADFAGNVDLVKIHAQDTTPIEAIRYGLAMHGEPGHAAGNMYWIYDLLKTAQNAGIGTILTGQGGNATVSWTGKSNERMIKYYIKNKNWKNLFKYLVFPVTPLLIQRTISTAFSMKKMNWQGSAIHPNLARRLDLAHKYIESTGLESNPTDWQSPRLQRYSIIKPGASFLGNIWAENSAACAMEVRDATFDKRVMEFVIAVPDREFLGPDGYDRWLIRRAMQGLMPDEVRLNRRRGRQAADLGQRLLDSAAEMETALAEVETSEMAQQYLAVDRIRNVWIALQKEITKQTTHHAVTILTRGLMAGLYLADLEKVS